MDAIQRANSGHPGMPMGMADLGVVLWTKHLVVDPADPTWPDRDRFVLSNGHGSMLLYSLLHLSGFDLSMDDLRDFRQWGSVTAGHPEREPHLGIEMTTGPLGQGLATAVGMAIAEEHLRAVFGADLMDHHTYVFAGDGDLMEGISSEAASLAGHQALGRLDRPVRRQRDLHRWQHRHRLHRGRPGPVDSNGMAHARHRRPRPCRPSTRRSPLPRRSTTSRP